MLEKTGLSQSAIAWITMFLIGGLWGFTIPLSKIAVSTGHQPFGLIFWQVVIAVIVLGGVQVYRGWRPQLSAGVLLFCCGVSFTGTLIPNSTSYLAQQHLPAGVMAIVIATVPMFSLALALTFRIEKASLIRFMGIVFGFAAMVLIVLPDTSLPDPEKAIYVLVALIAPVFYGIESIFVSMKQPKNIDAITILFMASLIGCFIALPAALLSDQWIDPFQPWGNAEWALIVSSVIHAIVYCTFIWLISYAGPVFSDQAAYPVTLSGVLFSMVILGEVYSAWIWVSLGLVILGLVMVQPRFSAPETKDLIEEPANG